MRYFAAHRYRVVDIEIGTISSQPISEVKYMGTKGYHIDVNLLILEVSEDTNGQRRYEKGDRLTLHNGKVIIKEDPAQKGNWLISSISSNLMP